jgi:hypothetical protein
MEENPKIFRNISVLVSNARLQKGFSTLKEFYRVKAPFVDYQTWLHIESGRRIPAPSTLVSIGDLLDIPREDLIIAYCKDKFNDVLSHQTLEAFQTKSLFDLSAFMHVKEYDRTDDYVFTAEQIQAMQEDPRLRLYLIYTYDRDQNTTISRLVDFFQVEIRECQAVVERLQSLGLVEVAEDNVKKIYPHTSVPMTGNISALRKNLLLKSLDLTVNSESYISNCHVDISEKSYRKILRIFDFIEANLLTMEKEDQNELNTSRFQVVIAGSKINAGSRNSDDKKQKNSR